MLLTMFSSSAAGIGCAKIDIPKRNLVGMIVGCLTGWIKIKLWKLRNKTII